MAGIGFNYGAAAQLASSNIAMNKNVGGMTAAWLDYLKGPGWREQRMPETYQIPSWFSEQYQASQFGPSGGTPADAPSGAPGAPSLSPQTGAPAADPNLPQPQGGAPGAAPGGQGQVGGSPFNVTNVDLITPEQQAYYSQFMSAMSPQLTSIASGQAGGQPNDAAFEDMWKTAILAPAEKKFEETTLPSIGQSFVGPGYWGGVRSEAEATARQDFDARMDAERSRLVWANELDKRRSTEFGQQLSLASVSPYMQALSLPTFSPTLWEPGAIPTEEQYRGFPQFRG